VPPPTTMLGALMRYLREADPAHFQPMNSNFGLVDPLETPSATSSEAGAALRAGAGGLRGWMSHHGVEGIATAWRPSDDGGSRPDGWRRVRDPELEDFSATSSTSGSSRRARCAPTATTSPSSRPSSPATTAPTDWSWSGVDRLAIRSFMGDCITRRGLAKRSVARKLSAVRSLFRFLHVEELVEANPARDVRSPKRERTLPGFLTREQVEQLFRAAEGRALDGGFLAVRNHAIVELFYSTGCASRSCSSSTSPTSTSSPSGCGCSARGARSGSSPSAAGRRALRRYEPRRDEVMIAGRHGADRRALFVGQTGRRLSSGRSRRSSAASSTRSARTRASPPTRCATASPPTWWTPAPT
jgi:site-specific recombinase XerD